VTIVNVAEYGVITTNPNGGVQIPSGTPLAVYDIAVGASATAGPVFQPGTSFIRMNTDVSCRIRLDRSPVAGAQDCRFAANQTEYWGVPASGMSISTLASP